MSLSWISFTGGPSFDLVCFLCGIILIRCKKAYHYKKETNEDCEFVHGAGVKVSWGEEDGRNWGMVTFVKVVNRKLIINLPQQYVSVTDVRVLKIDHWSIKLKFATDLTIVGQATLKWYSLITIRWIE